MGLRLGEDLLDEIIPNLFVILISVCDIYNLKTTTTRKMIDRNRLRNVFFCKKSRRFITKH